MSISSAAPVLRCPGCSSHVRPGSEWCALCYVDLRPAPDPAPAAEPARGPAPAFAPSGKHARRSAAGEQQADNEIDALGVTMLAELAASQRSNPLGPMSGVLDSKGKQVAAIVGGGLLGMALLLLLMYLLGAAL